MTTPADRVTRRLHALMCPIGAIGFRQPEMYFIDTLELDGGRPEDLIDDVKDGRVDFDYHGRHQELFKDITPADVVWVSRLLARLTDQQWNDAFRAAAYPEDVRRRYISKLKLKIQEGLALETQAATTQ